MYYNYTLLKKGLTQILVFDDIINDSFGNILTT